MKISEILSEGTSSTQDLKPILAKFLPFVQERLGLDDLPEIDLLDEPLEGTFGRYGDGKIRLMATGRHPIDVLRTLAHELIHYKQDSEGRIKPDSGKTGSPEENEANAGAGIIMRDFDQANPELLSALRESVDHANKISFKIKKGKTKFATELLVNGISAGIYQYDANSGRSIAELYPEYRGQGLGKLLVLHAIYTAAQLGMAFQEDESRTAEYDNVLDSLSSNGYIVDDDGYWYVTGEGEDLLNSSLNENFKDGRNPQDKGDAKRHGINTKASVSSLRKTAKQGGRKGQLAHWLANMKAGRAKKR